MSMEGNKSLMSRAWNALVDTSIPSISILGQGGIGKTRLMKQLYNKLITTKHFDHAIWITVSSKLIFQKVQSDIARNMGIFDTNWAEKSSKEKSETIRGKMSGKKCVVFLDDLWFQLDLTALGVEGSKFIYSSRSKSMLMGDSSGAVFRLKELSEADAWELFRHKVGDETLSNLKNMEIAHKLVSRCRGLPILISTLGRAMASRRTDNEWEYALGKIKRYRPWNSNEEVIFNFCFDSLPNSTTLWFLLYFSIFPEDFTIHKKELIDFLICEGYYLHGFLTLKDSTVTVGYNAINALIESGLVEEENDSVKLLDMIRDVAISWPFNDYQLLEKPATIDSRVKFFWRAATIIDRCVNCYWPAATSSRAGTIDTPTLGWTSSMEKSIRNIVPPNLETFLLNYDPFIAIRLGHVSGMFGNFARCIGWRPIGGDELTVLDLSNSGIEEVPREISRLVSLQYLNLSYTWIECLPIEMKMLTNLHCLNLEHDDQLRMIPKELISSLHLNVLKMFRCGYSVEELESNILSVTNMDITPLLSLRLLKVLSITITCISALHKLCNNPKLSSCTQSLSLEVLWGSKSVDIAPLAAMENLLTFEIHQAEHLETFNGNYSELLGKTSFERLREVTLEKCLNLQELTWIILAPNLTVLRVKSCEEIKEIVSSRRLGEGFKAEENLKPFTKLEILSLDDLPGLKSVYWKALPFQSLKKMEIIDCCLLKKLPLNSRISKAGEVVIEAEEEWWNNVEWEDEASRTTFLSSFRPLW